MESNGSVKKRYYAIQDYTLKELMAIYKLSRYRLRLKLSPIEGEIGTRKKNHYEKDQVEKIFRLVPLPSDVEIIT